MGIIQNPLLGSPEIKKPTQSLELQAQEPAGGSSSKSSWQPKVVSRPRLSSKIKRPLRSKIIVGPGKI